MSEQALTARLNGKTILVTGSPGFIGAAVVLRLLEKMDRGTVVSLDSMNHYYEVSLKEARLARIEEAAEKSQVQHVFVRGSIADKPLVENLFATYHFDIVVNLAAQGGGTLFHRSSGRVHRVQHRRVLQYA